MISLKLHDTSYGNFADVETAVTIGRDLVDRTGVPLIVEHELKASEAGLLGLPEHTVIQYNV